MLLGCPITLKESSVMRQIIQLGIQDRKPVPWSPPSVFRRGTKKNPKLVIWQSVVAKYAQAAMSQNNQTIYTGGPVHFCVRFFYKCNKSALPGDPVWLAKDDGRSGIADVSNLVKGLEDALQGVVFDNDCQVCSFEASRRYAMIEGFSLRVFAVEGSRKRDSFDDADQPIE